MDNVQDAQNFAAVAEGGMITIGDHLQRINELLIQGANDTNSTESRKAILVEIKQRINDIDIISQSTQFNGRTMLDGSFDPNDPDKRFVVQIGAVQDANVGLGIDPTINQTVETTVSNTSASVEPVEVPPINVTNTPPVEPVNVTPVTPVEATPISVAPQPEQEPINITPIQPEPTPVMPPEMGEINVTPETSPAPEPVQAENQTLNNFTGINIEPVLQPVPPVNNMTESNPVNLPYGGANPAATITPLQEENKVIYGGADPLAGTGVIPQVSNDQVTELKKPEDIESL